MNEQFIANLLTVLREIRQARRELGEDVPEPASTADQVPPHDTAHRLLWGRPERLAEGLSE